MEIRIDKDTTLTTNHAASSYNQPVLVRNGQAYGPLDEVDEGVFGFTPASEIVLNFARKENIKAAMTHGGLMLAKEQAALVEKFLVSAGLAED